ncbi:Ferrochelatase-2 [Arachis hypogaea]|nr:Ferrochelatase-2 [Arachis hypogaea]
MLQKRAHKEKQPALNLQPSILLLQPFIPLLQLLETSIGAASAGAPSIGAPSVGVHSRSQGLHQRSFSLAQTLPPSTLTQSSLPLPQSSFLPQSALNPHHNTRRNTKWRFLEGVRVSGALPPRTVLVQQCICDEGVLEVLCNYAAPSKKFQPSRHLKGYFPEPKEQGNVAGELQRTACFVCEKHPVELCNILVYFIYPTRIGLQRSEQLRELYKSLKAVEASPQTKRRSAALSPEDLTDTECEEAGWDVVITCHMHKVMVNLIMQELKARGINNKHTLAYQSRVGLVQWLKPYTDETLVELGQKGVRSLLAVPVSLKSKRHSSSLYLSFVSEHIETLEEIDMEYREFGRCM